METLNVIKNVFDDNRKVEPLEPTMHIYRAEDNTIIYLDIQLEDFTVEELIRNVEKAEELYEEYGCQISVYIICPYNVEVKVREFPIKSEADFTIKLANTDLNPYQMVLDVIKDKLAQGITLNSEDMYALELLPMVCPVEEQHRVRNEVFKIFNEL